MHENTTQCCNHTFTVKDVKPPLLKQRQALSTQQRGLFGGRIDRFSKAECPECQKEYLLWLEQIRNGWKVITISKVHTKDDSLPDKNDRQAIKDYLDSKGIEYHKQTKTELLYEKVSAHE